MNESKTTITQFLVVHFSGRPARQQQQAPAAELGDAGPSGSNLLPAVVGGAGSVIVRRQRHHAGQQYKWNKKLMSKIKHLFYKYLMNK